MKHLLSIGILLTLQLVASFGQFLDLHLVIITIKQLSFILFDSDPQSLNFLSHSLDLNRLEHHHKVQLIAQVDVPSIRNIGNSRPTIIKFKYTSSNATIFRNWTLDYAIHYSYPWFYYCRLICSFRRTIWLLICPFDFGTLLIFVIKFELI